MKKSDFIEDFDNLKNHCIEELYKLGVFSYKGKFVNQLSLSELKTRLAIEKALIE